MTVGRRPPSDGGVVLARSANRLAWLLYGAVLVLIGCAVGLWLVVHRPVPGAVGYAYWREGLVNGPAFATVGVLVATRRPEHPVGWLFLSTGLVTGVQLAAGEYAAAMLASSGASSAVAVAAWVSYQAQWALGGPLMALLLVFPTGRPPSRRWWVVGWVGAAGVVLGLVGQGLAPTSYEDFPGVDNPFGVLGLATFLGWLMGVANALFAVGLLGAFASLIVRFFGARGQERQQLKWFVYATVVGFAVLLLPGLLPSRFPGLDREVAGNYAWTLAPASLSAAAALAVLRYRLYDIDRVINRTLVYGLLTAVLGLSYVGAVLVLGQVFGGVTRDPPSWAVAGATLAVAAVFRPARRRIQQVVDRRFNRRRHDAARIIEAFGARLREHVDLDTLSTELLGVADQTMQPTTASLWLRPATTGPKGRARPPGAGAQGARRPVGRGLREPSIRRPRGRRDSSCGRRGVRLGLGFGRWPAGTRRRGRRRPTNRRAGAGLVARGRGRVRGPGQRARPCRSGGG
jgi:hypothetical protein